MEPQAGYRLHPQGGLLERVGRFGSDCPILSEQPGFDIIPEAEWEGLILAEKPNLSSLAWYVSSQASVGSCAAEAINNMVAVIREQMGLPRVKFNPYAMYHFSSGGSDRGSTLSENLQIARDDGCVPMSLWGREKGWRATPSDEALAARVNYRIDEYYGVANWAEMMTALIRGWGIYWGYSGHAIGGVDPLNSSQFMLLNSWGQWGRGTDYSTMNYGFGVAERRSVMWSYGVYAVRTAVVEPIDWLTTGYELAKRYETESTPTEVLAA